MQSFPADRSVPQVPGSVPAAPSGASSVPGAGSVPAAPAQPDASVPAAPAAPVPEGGKPAETPAK
jgi:preprotein translocase subunit SecG